MMDTDMITADIHFKILINPQPNISDLQIQIQDLNCVTSTILIDAYLLSWPTCDDA